MKCFATLVDSKFLANARTQMIDARARIVSEVAPTPENNTHFFDRNTRQQNYYTIGNMYGFFDQLYSLDIVSNRIYYLNYDCYMMIMSRNKPLVDSAIIAAHNVNGDVPLFRTKHKFNGKLVHCVLFNTNFTIPPATLN
jgi:hypothetical protein